MSKSTPSNGLSRFLLLASIAIVIVALYTMQEVLVPIALAMLLSFLLAPLVHYLEKAKLPRPLAVTVAVLIAFGLIGGIGYIVYAQSADLSAHSTEYVHKLQAKATAIRDSKSLHWLKNADDEVKNVMSGSATKPATTGAIGTESPAMKVQVVNAQEVRSQQTGNSSFMDWVGYARTTFLGPLGTVVIVIVFAVFMLLQREDLRDRLIRLMGRDQLTTTTQALDDAASRVSRYLVMQTIVNGSVGLLAGVILWVVGKCMGTPFPSPALWGLLTALLRFIPYLGIWVAALLPSLLALAVFDSAKGALFAAGGYFIVELTVSNTLEPLLIGSSTGIATLAVLVAAAFWYWIWGFVGLLLSTPLTVCLVVMGKYVSQLEFLTILLGEEPALSPPDRVYQRLMATNIDEAHDLIEEYQKTMSLEELYDTVLMPALGLAEHDRRKGGLDDDRQKFIRKSMRDIVEELSDRSRANAVADAAAAEVELAKGKTPSVEKPANSIDGPGRMVVAPPGGRVSLPKGCTVNVLCLPADDEADEIVGLMLAHLLELRGYCVTVASVNQLASEMVQTAQSSKADVVCVSALPPSAVTHARYLCKRLHGTLPSIEMTIGLWGVTGDIARAKDRIACVQNVQIATQLRQAIEQIHQLAQAKLTTAAG